MLYSWHSTSFLLLCSISNRVRITLPSLMQLL
nr:MAG TPA: hypothetical protein [Caudoviricetes sp.]DAV59972.1 MAG TPA: hypothetical protein [Caudoviricetes sp.]